MQFSCKVREKVEEAILGCRKVQFFSWSSVQFLLNVHYFGVRELVKVSLFRDILPYEFVGVLNVSFLPRRVGIRKVHGDILFPFHIQSLCNEFVSSKLAAIVRGDGLDGTAVGEELLDHSLGDRDSLFACPYALHQQHIGTSLHQCQYHVLPAVHNQVHLPITETGAVGFFRTVMDTRPVRYIGGFG